MLFPRHTEQFSLANFLSNWSCLFWSYLRELSWLVSLISPNFPFLVFLKLFFLTTVCWISATWCFSWIMIIWIAFEPLLVVQTALIVCYGKNLQSSTGKFEKASLIFVWNVCKKSLVSMLHCLKQLLWNRIVRGICAPGFTKSDNLFTGILIDVWRLLFSTACSVGFHVFRRKLLKPGRSELLLDKLFKRDFSYCSAIEVF